MLGQRRPKLMGWWLALPTAVILGIVLILTNTAQAAPTFERQLLTQLRFQEQEPPCQGCHPDQYAAWQGTLHANAVMDPIFQDALFGSHDPSVCLPCHTTGFDAGTGHFLAEGVTCEACHGPYKEGHPKAETMQLPMESATCRVCHQSAFRQWENSKHAQSRIDCFDCHQAHSQGLRMGSVQNLCSACHANEQTALAHSVHGIRGVDCASCHMTPLAHSAADSGSGSGALLSNHAFTVASDVCTRCHTSSAHKGVGLSQTTNTSSVGSTVAVVEQQSQRVQELERQLNESQKRATDLQNVAVVSMGLSLGLGGVVGLLIGVGATALLGRRKSQ